MTPLVFWDVDAPKIVIWLQTLRNNLSVPSLRVIQSQLLERCSRNVGNQLPNHAGQHLRRAEVSVTSRHCPEISNVYKFRVCKSVHHHTFKSINQPDASVSQLYCLSFKYSSTCFGHPHAHHQELVNCSSRLRFYRWNVVVAVSLVVVGPDRPRPTALSPRSNGKTGGGCCSWQAPDDGHEDARNMLSCI